MNKIKEIKKAIAEAIQLGPIETLSGLEGYSGKKLIASLQRISKQVLDANTCYLEIGVYRGLTLTSVSKILDSNVKTFGIDNFAFFDKEEKNQKIIQSAFEKHEIKNAILINEDYENALENLSNYIGDKKVGVYFIDGPHDYRSQLMCLELCRKHLAEESVIFIDDSNYEHVRQANCDFLKSHPEFKLMYENYSDCHPENLNDESIVRENWWNGINIIVHDPNNELETKYPPTERNRQKFENEHIIHSTRNSQLAPYTHLMFETFFTFKWYSFVKATVMYRRAKKTYFKDLKLNRGKYLYSNTNSANLKEWINPKG